MKNKKKFGLLVLLGLALVLAFSFLPVNLKQVEAATPLSGNVVGWMWSSDIGWLKLDSNLNTPVKVVDNNLVGYAWSSNLGWVRFGTDLTGPVGKGDNWGAKIADDGTVTGWARVCSVYVSGCSGVAKDVSGPELGGWDGWIKMTNARYNLNSQTFSGYAWGSLNLGWLRFWPENNPNPDSCTDPVIANRPANCNPACVGGSCGGTTDTLSCSVNPPSGEVGDTFSWTAISSADPSGTKGTYTWAGEKLVGKTGKTVTAVYDAKGTKSGSVTVLLNGIPQTKVCATQATVCAKGETVDATGNCSANVVACTITPGSSSRISYYQLDSDNKYAQKAEIVISSGCANNTTVTQSGTLNGFNLVCSDGGTSVDCSKLSPGNYQVWVTPPSPLPTAGFRNLLFSLSAGKGSSVNLKFDYLVTHQN